MLNRDGIIEAVIVACLLILIVGCDREEAADRNLGASAEAGTAGYLPEESAGRENEAGMGNQTGKSNMKTAKYVNGAAGGNYSNPAYPIVDTAQNSTYDLMGEITAPSVWQAFYGQDAQFAGHQPSYVLSTDGKTVIDKVTELTWMRGPKTALTPPTAADKKGLSQAKAWIEEVNAMNYGGYDDWRLPTIKELYSLIKFSGTDPSGFVGSSTSMLTPFIDTGYFNFGYGQTSAGERLIDSQYASCTTFVSKSRDAGSLKVFGVNFADGRIKGYDTVMRGGREKTFFMQLVRGPEDYGVNSFVDNGDGTVIDKSTGLVWSKTDSGSPMTWQEALAWAQKMNKLNYLGQSDWRLPNAKELQSLVSYANAPDYNALPAINVEYFTCTKIINENGDIDYPYYWTSTTHAGYTPAGLSGRQAVYVAFGRALGWPADGWVDVHGAGSQRSDPKSGPLFIHAQEKVVTSGAVSYTGYAFGPQGDAVRGQNFVRLVRNANVQ